MKNKSQLQKLTTKRKLQMQLEMRYMQTCQKKFKKINHHAPTSKKLPINHQEAPPVNTKEKVPEESPNDEAVEVQQATKGTQTDAPSKAYEGKQNEVPHHAVPPVTQKEKIPEDSPSGEAAEAQNATNSI